MGKNIWDNLFKKYNKVLVVFIHLNAELLHIISLTNGLAIADVAGVC